MMRSVHVDTCGARHTKQRPTMWHFLHPKDTQNYRMILGATPLNQANDCRPEKFMLSGLEQHQYRMRLRPGGGGVRHPYVAKLDRQNAFWSICLSVAANICFVDNRSYRYTSMPFGWPYSPLICHTLVKKWWSVPRGAPGPVPGFILRID